MLQVTANVLITTLLHLLLVPYVYSQYGMATQRVETTTGRDVPTVACRVVT